MAFPNNGSAQAIDTRHAVDRTRFLTRFREISAIGATVRGGVDRQALSAGDIETHRTVIGWFSDRDYSVRIDQVGNLFITRPGTTAHAAAVAVGSHLDSQPTGGCFDGALGVVAGAEVLARLDDLGIETPMPIQLIVWMNEEGSRFPPVTMGSSFAAGVLDQATILNTRDSDGHDFRAELGTFVKALGVAPENVPLPETYLELHIEQGPVLEAGGQSIGLVDGVQGLRQFEVRVQGRTAHAGTTPKAHRRDAFVQARGLMEEFDNGFDAFDDNLRFTIGVCQVRPGAPNTVPEDVRFTIDLRHPDEGTLDAAEALIRRQVGNSGPGRVALKRMLAQAPIIFDRACRDAIERGARFCGVAAIPMLSGATHDAAAIAHRTACGMIFVPSRDGISHHPDEYTGEADMVAGADVLLQAVLLLGSGTEAPLASKG